MIEREKSREAVTKHDGGAHILDIFASFVCDGKLCNPVHLKLCNTSPRLPQALCCRLNAALQMGGTRKKIVIKSTDVELCIRYTVYV